MAQFIVWLPGSAKGTSADTFSSFYWMVLKHQVLVAQWHYYSLLVPGTPVSTLCSSIDCEEFACSLCDCMISSIYKFEDDYCGGNLQRPFNVQTHKSLGRQRNPEHTEKTYTVTGINVQTPPRHNCSQDQSQVSGTETAGWPAAPLCHPWFHQHVQPILITYFLS